MRNLTIDANGCLVRANLCKLNDPVRFEQRRKYQIAAFEDSKELESLAFLAVECKCIIPRQYKQISLQICEGIKFLTAWMKSDEKRTGK